VCFKVSRYNVLDMLECRSGMGAAKPLTDGHCTEAKCSVPLTRKLLPRARTPVPARFGWAVRKTAACVRGIHANQPEHTQNLAHDIKHSLGVLHRISKTMQSVASDLPRTHVHHAPCESLVKPSLRLRRVWNRRIIFRSHHGAQK
jgi:hypothetical protein